VVGSAKCGPDYIDPGMHTLATGRPSVNLDSWAMRPALFALLQRHLETDAELVICEGVMGLFDGLDTSDPDCDGSTSSVAKRTAWPVILVVDVAAQSKSAAALVKGFAEYQEGVTVCAVILNRVGSAKHRASCQDAIERLGIPVVGALPRDEAIHLDERHLGLVQANEIRDPDAFLDTLASFVEANVDLDRVRSLAAPGRDSEAVDSSVRELPPPGRRVALARDAAFSFVYPHILAAWRRAGAEILPFSPLADQGPSDDADSCWLPGGYPELHAGVLASNSHFIASLKRFAETRPIHGECGGYMVLGEYIYDADGNAHRMAGLLGHSTSFAKRRLHLGYREARLACPSLLGAPGLSVRGHEFHYATVVKAGDDEPLFDESSPSASDRCPGTRRGGVSGSFFHLLDAMEAG
jgi:cobyrinic acid a,c-diamide synthase